jgi:limonene-1,2-epoxide hydrolase
MVRHARPQEINMAQTSPLDVVRRFLKGMEVSDYDNALTLVAENCEYTNPPPLGTVHGPGAIRGILEPFFAPTLETTFVLLREAAAGPIVFVERLYRHRLADKWVELPVTGVFELHDGKITVWRDYFDAATILSQWPTA